MFEFFTKEGRARKKARKLAARKMAWERKLSECVNYQKAYYILHAEDGELYSILEHKCRRLQALNLMMDSYENREVLRWGDNGQIDENPLNTICREIDSFVSLYLSGLKDRIASGVNEIDACDIERLLVWAGKYSGDALVQLYELKQLQNDKEGADMVRREAEYRYPEHWYWKKFEQKLPPIPGEDVIAMWSRVNDGSQYEKFIVKLLKSVNIFCDRVGGSGDQGVDVIVYAGERKAAIQCKFYSSPVDNAAVQQVYAGMKFHDCTEAYVVTNSTYTPGAVELATKLGVKLCSHLNLLDNFKGLMATDEELDEWTAMGTVRGIRETLARHPGVFV